MPKDINRCIKEFVLVSSIHAHLNCACRCVHAQGIYLSTCISMNAYLSTLIKRNSKDDVQSILLLVLFFISSLCLIYSPENLVAVLVLIRIRQHTKQRLARLRQPPGWLSPWKATRVFRGSNSQSTGATKYMRQQSTQRGEKKVSCSRSDRQPVSYTHLTLPTSGRV